MIISVLLKIIILKAIYIYVNGKLEIYTFSKIHGLHVCLKVFTKGQATSTLKTEIKELSKTKEIFKVVFNSRLKDLTTGDEVAFRKALNPIS